MAMRRGGGTLCDIAARLGVSFLTAKRYAARVDAPSCECGRLLGHKGHCSKKLNKSNARQNGFGRKRGVRIVWTQEADGVLRAGFERGDDLLSDIGSQLEPLLGYIPTLGALYCRVERLNIKRPPDYWVILGRRKKLGRPKGSKNKRPYVRRAKSLVATQTETKSDKRLPFSMSAMAGVDPYRDLRLAQAAVASQGRLS